MEKFKSLNRYDIEQALSAEEVRTTQIILMAMFLGTILFLVPITILNSAKPAPQTPVGISEFTQLFIYGIIAFAAIAYSTIYILPRILLTKTAIEKRIESAGIIKENVQAAKFLIIMDRQFRIIKFALFEGVSLFAIVGIFLEMTSSSYQISGDIWLFTLPIAIHAFYLFSNFPAKENIANDIEKNIIVKIN